MQALFDYNDTTITDIKKKQLQKNSRAYNKCQQQDDKTTKKKRS